MLQPQMRRELDELLRTAERILQANGFQIITTDDHVFPNAKPALAALKNGRLLICLAELFSATDQFLNPNMLNHIRDELDTLVRANRPETDSRVETVDKVALVLVPGDITIASPAGDVKWLVVEQVDELPEEMDKVLDWA